MPDVSDTAVALAMAAGAPPAPPPPLPDRRPVWIGYDTANGPDQLGYAVMEQTEWGFRFLGFVPIGAVADARETLK